MEEANGRNSCQLSEQQETPSEEVATVSIPPIMRIPREVRGIIFNRLPQNEIIKLRYVCRDWKSEVDDFCEFSVILDERQPYLERISQLRIKKCRVFHFMDPLPINNHNAIENDEEIVNNMPNFLKCPSLLRSLKIQTDKISPTNFHILIKDTCQNLREFCAVLPLHILTYNLYPSELYLRFDNLTKLRISVSTMPNEPVMGPPRFQDQLFYKILEFPMKKLKMLAVEIRCLGFQQVSKFSSLILSFIAAQHQTIEHIDFDMIQGHGMPLNEIRPLYDSDLKKIDFKSLKKVCKLESIRVVNSTAIGIDIWSEILAQQKALRFMETDILPAPNALYKQIILNNQDTLVHIDIGDLTIDVDGEDEDMKHFDVSVFQNCVHLRKLTLDRNCLRRRPPGQAQSAELINLHSLPEYIEELAINYFLVLSDELLILFSQAGQNLKSLTLTQCGDSGEFGVDGTVLEKIISLRDISFIEISPLNFSLPEERVKLNAILTTFGYNQDHSYFQLSKVSHNFQISFDDFLP
ncbi:unnamed protein product [Orchesella dallaii]|uniref:F-box domain-containing protein n=1 Tax=Orchesella dallaii TaxID=48710 RepID=A0ABP1RFQ1_9HEXA